MKGKAAAQNANRRTAEALERVDRLATELAAEKEGRKAEVAALIADLREIRGQVDQLADERAAERIAAARADAEQLVAVTRAVYREKATVSVRELFDACLGDSTYVHGKHVITIAERFDVDPADVASSLSPIGVSRYTKRITWDELRKNYRRLNNDKKTPRRTRTLLSIEDKA